MTPNHNEDINILIADDNADILLSLKSLLERDGLYIFTTTSPHRAVQICNEHDISIALFDVKMPEISGYELLELVKKNTAYKAYHGDYDNRPFYALKRRG